MNNTPTHYQAHFFVTVPALPQGIERHHIMSNAIESPEALAAAVEVLNELGWRYTTVEYDTPTDPTADFDGWTNPCGASPEARDAAAETIHNWVDRFVS